MTEMKNELFISKIKPRRGKQSLCGWMPGHGLNPSCLFTERDLRHGQVGRETGTRDSPDLHLNKCLGYGQEKKKIFTVWSWLPVASSPSSWGEKAKSVTREECPSILGIVALSGRPFVSRGRTARLWGQM